MTTVITIIIVSIVAILFVFFLGFNIGYKRREKEKEKCSDFKYR